MSGLWQCRHIAKAVAFAQILWRCQRTGLCALLRCFAQHIFFTSKLRCDRNFRVLSPRLEAVWRGAYSKYCVNNSALQIFIEIYRADLWRALCLLIGYKVKYGQKGFKHSVQIPLHRSCMYNLTCKKMLALVLCAIVYRKIPAMHYGHLSPWHLQRHSSNSAIVYTALIISHVT